MPTSTLSTNQPSMQTSSGTGNHVWSTKSKAFYPKGDQSEKANLSAEKPGKTFKQFVPSWEKMSSAVPKTKDAELVSQHGKRPRCMSSGKGNKLSQQQSTFSQADTECESRGRSGSGESYECILGQDAKGSQDGGSSGDVNQSSDQIENTRQSNQKRTYKSKEERHEFSSKVQMRKKTEMCRNIVMHGCCKYGADCSYAHNAEELVVKSHLPSNYKTKLCTQYHDSEIGYCLYGERCQFLHSIYDLNEKLSYSRGLKEEARLTHQRISQGSDCVFVNLVNGKGCVAPDKRLPVFEAIYNKEQYKADLLSKGKKSSGESDGWKDAKPWHAKRS